MAVRAPIVIGQDGDIPSRGGMSGHRVTCHDGAGQQGGGRATRGRLNRTRRPLRRYPPTRGGGMLRADELMVVHHDDTVSRFTDVAYTLGREGLRIVTSDGDVKAFP